MPSSLLLILLLKSLIHHSFARWLTPHELTLSTGAKRPAISLPGGWVNLAAHNGTRPIIALEYTTLPLQDTPKIHKAIMDPGWPSDVRVSPRQKNIDIRNFFNSSGASTVFVTSAADGSSKDLFHFAGWSVQHLVSQVFVALRRDDFSNGQDWIATGVENGMPFVLSCPADRLGARERRVANINALNIPESDWRTTSIAEVPQFARDFTEKEVLEFFKTSTPLALDRKEIHYSSWTPARALRSENKGDIPDRDLSPLQIHPFIDDEITCERIALSGSGAQEIADGILQGLEEFLEQFRSTFSEDGPLSEASSVLRALEAAPQVEFLTGPQGFILVVLPTIIGICELLAHGVPRKKLHYILLLAICMYEILALIFFWHVYAEQRKHGVMIQAKGVTSAVPVLKLRGNVELETAHGSFEVVGLRSGESVTVARSEMMQIVSYQMGTDFIWAVVVSVGLAIELLIAGWKIAGQQRQYVREIVEKRRAERMLRANLSNDIGEGFEYTSGGVSYYLYEQVGMPDDF